MNRIKRISSDTITINTWSLVLLNALLVWTLWPWFAIGLAAAFPIGFALGFLRRKAHRSAPNGDTA